ncbi:EAL domain-containing protein [Sneathiella limimaris]|uniref:EAL domain-containing protein n=1 Tax=Sneathiella limimaris TaxID=1964213 RepID=UPI00146AC0E6|nr:EAL domain-containing protein [Sneathiella limimaris]
MHRIQVKKGDVILSDKEIGEYAYIVESGKVAVTDRASSLGSYTLGPGDMFGEYGLIEEATHYSTAVAAEDSLLVVISQSDIEEKSAIADPLLSLFLDFFMDRCHNLTLKHYGTDEQIQTFSSRRHHREKRLQTSSEELVQRFKIKDELQAALENSEFELFFQPIISLRGGFTSGFEALIRWNHPEKGLLTPYHFIDMAEQTDMIGEIGNWVFKDACLKAKEFNDQASKLRSPEVFVSVNISAKQFSEPDLVERFKTIARETDVKPDHVELEITESILMADTNGAKEMLQELKKFGFKIVLDDFGTGYSSLSYLHKFPIDKLKIDRSFTHAMLDDQDSQEIVRAIAGLSHNMNLEIVAEGIETMEQLSLYRDLDCHFGQGYLISKPLPIDQVYQILGTRMSFGEAK